MSIFQTITENLLPGILGAAAGVGGSVLTFKTNKQKSVDDSIKQLLDRYEKENEELRSQNKKMIERLTSLEVKVILLESSTYDLPFPMWLKDLDGTMLSLNPEYETKFLLPMSKKVSDYIGENDSAIWDDETCDRFKVHDDFVKRSKIPWIGIEELIINGTLEKWKIVKFPRFVGTTLIGIGGIALPNDC